MLLDAKYFKVLCFLILILFQTNAWSIFTELVGCELHQLTFHQLTVQTDIVALSQMIFWHAQHLFPCISLYPFVCSTNVHVFWALCCSHYIVLFTLCCPTLWPSGIGSRLGRNRLWVRFLAVSDIYPMFIEPTITWVPSGSLGTYGSTQKLC